MKPWARSKYACRVIQAIGLGLLAFCTAAACDPLVAAAKEHTVVPRLRAYAEVEPISVAKLRAAHAGVIEGLTVVPGEAVKAGALLGRLQGPEMAAELARRKAAVASARAALKGARRVLTIARQERAVKLSTRKALYESEAAAAQAQAGLASAQAALTAAEHSAELRAPDAGTVMSLAAADGERVEAGQTVLTVQPSHHLWLKAVYYGPESRRIRPGMRGQFMPADGSAPIAVTVASVLSSAQPDGGRPVGLRATGDKVSWVSGEAGTVILKGAAHSAVMVPTRALILDRGKWWVVVHTAKGEQRRAVTPGPRRDNETEIEHGLAPDTEVIVDHAYPTFHSDFSQHYQPPD